MGYPKIKTFLLAVMLLALAAQANALTPWAETWTNFAYYTTNGESNNFRSALLRSEGRVGIRLNDTPTTVSPYVVYYTVFGQDPNYWNNNLAYGLGLRIKPFASSDINGWAIEWIRDIKLFTETLNLTFLKDQPTASTNRVKTNDFRFGMDVWHEWNLTNPNMDVPWAEMWGNITYRESNFYDETNFNKFQTFVNFLQLKVGRHMAGGVRPYLVEYLTTSGASQVWLNSLYYGVGLRMEPFREREDSPELLRKFRMFAEVMKIAWLANQDPTRPTSDMRFGVELVYGM